MARSEHSVYQGRCRLCGWVPALGERGGSGLRGRCRGGRRGSWGARGGGAAAEVQDLHGVVGGADGQGAAGEVFEAQVVGAAARELEGGEFADVVRGAGEGGFVDEVPAAVDELDDGGACGARQQLDHEFLLGGVLAVLLAPGAREADVALGDVDGGDAAVAVPDGGEVVPGGFGGGGPDVLGGVARVEHGDVVHDPGGVEVFFVEFDHVPLAVKPGFDPGVVAADVVPGEQADGARGDADGAQGADEQDALPGAGDFFLGEGFGGVHTGLAPLAGVDDAGGFRHVGGDGEDGFSGAAAVFDEGFEDGADGGAPVGCAFVEDEVGGEGVADDVFGGAVAPRVFVCGAAEGDEGEAEQGAEAVAQQAVHGVGWGEGERGVRRGAEGGDWAPARCAGAGRGDARSAAQRTSP